jgi:heavy metal sensor kinase
MNTLSIRFRLTLVFGAALGALLLAFAAFGYYFTRQNLLRTLDRQLHFDQEILEDHIEQLPDGSISIKPFGRHLGRFFEVEGFWWEVWAEDGHLLFRKWPFEESEVKLHMPLLPTTERAYTSAELPGGLRMRAMQKGKRYGERQLTLRVVRSESELHRALAELRLINLLALPVGLLLAGASGYMLSGRALAPVRLITDQARRITASSLSERVTVPNTRDEIGQLASVINETLARLEASFEELNRFTADASHELRTPLAAIRSVGQQALRENSSPEELRRALGGILEEEARLAALVEALLVLARADSGAHPLDRIPCDLTELTREVCDYYAVLAEAKQQQLQVAAGPSYMVPGDRALLRQAIINLVDNAIKYGNRGSMISLSLGSAAGKVCLSVSNQGPMIPREQQAKIFDRFYRADQARAAEQRGFGLGLAIVRWIARAHQGEVSVTCSEPGQPICFRLSLPG